MVINIEHYERLDTASEALDINSGYSATVQLQVDWFDRWEAAHNLIGTPWPKSPSTIFAPVCINVQISGESPLSSDKNQEIVRYKCAVLTCTYSTELEEDLISETLEPRVEFQKLDYRRFRWESGAGDPLTEGEAPGKQLRGLDLVRRIRGVQAVPTSILTLPGSVNQTAYSSPKLGLTFGAETLLFEPPQIERSITLIGQGGTAGTEGWNITYKMAVDPTGWNTFWRTRTQKYERIFNEDGAQYNNYPLDDFSPALA